MASSEFGDSLFEKFSNVPSNLIGISDYLNSARSIPEWEQRCLRVGRDTACINAMCELGGDFGSFYTGVYANQASEYYTFERVMAEAQLYVPFMLTIRAAVSD
jgi:hypothetical protein